jgi:hypothetical protein
MTHSIRSGQRVQHIVWLWEGSVASVEGDSVTVNQDSGDRETVPSASLRIIRKAPDVRASELRRIRATLYNQTRNYWRAARVIRLGDGDDPVAVCVLMHCAINGITPELRRAAMALCIERGFGMAGMVIETGGAA